MKALVTGGAGFIGSHLVDRLAADGHTVHVIDDFSTGSRENLLAAAPIACRDGTGVTFEENSVLNAEAVDFLVYQHDIVFHLAAAVGVRLIVEEPVRTLTTNIQGTENVLAACANHGKRVVIASSSEVYGQREDEMPLREDEQRVYGPTTSRRWAYAESKAIDEFMALAYRDEHGLDVRIARLFNTVGPRQTGAYGMVVPRFAEAAVTGREIEVFGDGTQTRSFCHVSDVVDGLMLLAGPPPGPWSPSRTIYNLGNPHNHTSILALAEAIQQIAKSDSEIVHLPHDEAYGVGIADMRHRRPDISRAYSDLGWSPRTPLGAILEEAVQEAERGVLSEA